MSRLSQLDPQTSSGPSSALFAAVKSKLGKVPNLVRALGHSPAALGAYLQMSGSLAEGSLSAREREQIALAVGQANGCDYCLAAHSVVGKIAGLTPEQIRDARLGTAVDARTDVLLRFVREVVEARGRVSDETLRQLRDQSFTDGEIAEAVANVALNVFTNYFNHVAETDIDFPRAAPLVSAAA